MTLAKSEKGPRGRGTLPSARVIAVIGALVIVASLIGAALFFAGNSDGPRASPGPEPRKYSLALYSVEVPSNWVLRSDDEESGIYLNSTWRDPAKAKTSILIQAEVPVPKAPVANAELVRARVGQSPGYRQLAFEPTSLAGRPAARWVFDVSGKRQVAYFVNHCEVGITVRGSTLPANFGSLEKVVREVTSSVSVPCR